MRNAVVMAILFLVFVAPMVSAGEQAAPRSYAMILATEDAANFLKKGPPNIQSFTMLGDRTVFLGGPTLFEEVKKANLSFEPVPLQGAEKPWLLTTKDPALRDFSGPGIRVILKVQGFRVFLADETTKMGLAHLQSDFTRIDPLPRNQVVLTPTRSPRTTRADDAVAAFLARLDLDGFKREVKDLADLKTRYTYSQGAVLALDYCEKAFKDLGLPTRRLEFSGSSTKRENLEAVQKGTEDREVLIVGHLDSTSPQASTLAPGADDNGTGSAGVLALARLFKDLPTKATIRYVLFLGEEQGLIGSKAYAALLNEATAKKITAVINMDMIGFDATAPLTMVIETNSDHQALAERLSELAGKYTALSHQISYNPWGSDHVPFLKKKIPTVLTIESEYDDNPTYHKTNDTPEKVNYDLSREILRLNAAAAVNEAGISLPADATRGK